MEWISIGYHFISSVVQCGIEHSAAIAHTAVDFAQCVSGKFFVS